MPVQFALSQAVTSLTRVIRVASGVFAPGHLGELTQIVPVGCCFAPALLHLFPEVGYGLVWKKLTTGLKGMPVVGLAKKAFRDLRRRLGSAPVKALFGVLAGPLAQPTTPGVRFGRWRTVSFDGCTSQKVPDTDRNRAWLGKDKKAG